RASRHLPAAERAETSVVARFTDRTRRAPNVSAPIGYDHSSERNVSLAGLPEFVRRFHHHQLFGLSNVGRQSRRPIAKRWRSPTGEVEKRLVLALLGDGERGC